MGAGDGRGAIRAATVRMPAPAHVAREQNGTLRPLLVPFALLRRLASEESAELGE